MVKTPEGEKLVSSGKNNLKAQEYYTDTPVSGFTPLELLSIARMKMLMEAPFYGKIAQNMALIAKEDNSVPTTAVDKSGRMYYHPQWVNALSVEDAIFEFAHEVMHVVKRCFDRFPKGGNHQLWNQASDMVIDTILIDSGFKPSFASKLAVDAKAIALVRKLETTEKVYMHLLEEHEKEQPKCKACDKAAKDLQKEAKKQDEQKQKENKKINEEDGGKGEDSGEGEGAPGDGEGEGAPGDGDGDAHTCGSIRMCCAGTSANLSDNDVMEKQKWIENLTAAKMFAESKGNMPGTLGSQIDALTKSVVRWQDYLRPIGTKIFGRDRYTFKRYSRRMRGMGDKAVRLPRAEPDGKSALLVFDTSGSMSPKQIAQAFAEASEIMRQCGAKELFVILHDYCVYHMGKVSKDSLNKLKLARGGTSHEEVFKLINGETVNYGDAEFTFPKNVSIELAVMFTDLGTSFPSKAPSCDVLWVVPSDSHPGMKATVPFGKKIEMSMDK